MSRSFGKISPGRSMHRGWHGCMRVRERLCIHLETRNGGQGNIIFPIVPEVSNPWHNDSYHYRNCKKEIRDDYFKEIRDILNGYSDRYDNYEELFLDCFNRIKGLLPIDGRGFRFEWLNSRKAKAIIRKWEGDPLDVLNYLARAKAIEEAANREYKRRNRK